MTLSNQRQTAAQLAQVQDLVASNLPDHWAVKDTFCELDLDALVFRFYLTPLGCGEHRLSLRQKVPVRGFYGVAYKAARSWRSGKRLAAVARLTIRYLNPRVSFYLRSSLILTLHS